MEMAFTNGEAPKLLFDACFRRIDTGECGRLGDQKWRLFYVGILAGQRPTDFLVSGSRATVRVEGRISDSRKFDLYRLIPARQLGNAARLPLERYDLVETSKQAIQSGGGWVLIDLAPTTASMGKSPAAFTGNSAAATT